MSVSKKLLISYGMKRELILYYNIVKDFGLLIKKANLLENLLIKK